MGPISGFFTPPEAPGREVPESLEPVSRRPGTWCEVWRGTRHGRFRVYKCLKEEFRGTPLYENMLRKEFEIGYSLRHNHIAEYYDFLDLPSLGRCIEMEWVDGSPIAPAEDSRRLALQLCDAVSCLHARQVVHKDLKPENILITHNGRNVKIIDFGFADADDTLLRTRAGTEGYAAPELREGGVFDTRTDIYSLGKVLEGMGFRRIARRCMAANPEKRPGIDAIRRAIENRVPWGWIIAAAAAVVLAALLLLPLKRPVAPVQKPYPDTTQAALPARVDTIVIHTVSPAPAAPVSAARKQVVPSPEPGFAATTESIPTTESSPDQDALDDIFRQATELFE